MLACELTYSNVGACRYNIMAQSQITITHAQLAELKETCATKHTRSIQGFNITFVVKLDENRKPYCESAVIENNALPLVAFPEMLSTNFVVPLPKEKKAK